MSTGQSKFEQGMLDFRFKAVSNNDFSEYVGGQEQIGAVNYYAQAPELKPATPTTTTVRTSSIIPSSLDTTVNNKQYISIATTYAAGSELYELLAKQNAPGYTPPPVPQQVTVKPVVQEPVQQMTPVPVPTEWDDLTPIMMRGSVNY